MQGSWEDIDAVKRHRDCQQLPLLPHFEQKQLCLALECSNSLAIRISFAQKLLGQNLLPFA